MALVPRKKPPRFFRTLPYLRLAGGPKEIDKTPRSPMMDCGTQ